MLKPEERQVLMEIERPTSEKYPPAQTSAFETQKELLKE
jgi:hypothetical protein